MAKLIKYLVVVNEAFSIPLALLLTLMIISGYGILYPSKIQVLTGGLTMEEAFYHIHTDKIIRLSLTTLLLIHIHTGLIILVEKYVKMRSLKKILQIIISIPLLYIYILLIIIETIL